MSEFAILKDREVVEVESSEEWAKTFERSNRTICRNVVGPILVSTVFLGLNHGWDGKKLWFETMIFGGEHDEYQERYATYDEAVAGHDKAVEMVRSEA